jgi:hypothetical protein
MLVVFYRSIFKNEKHVVNDRTSPAGCVLPARRNRHMIAGLRYRLPDSSRRAALMSESSGIETFERS